MPRFWWRVATVQRMRRFIVGALIATLGIIASPAAAATKSVGFNATDYIYLPERVAVTAGDSVTWSNTGSDEPHNVRFEDGKFTAPPVPSTGFSVTRNFSADGVYRYFCDNHGRDMRGVVYVNATGTVPPDARFRVSPNPAVAGKPVTFDASATNANATTKGDNPIAKYEWDLDGDGMFEKNTGTTPTVSQTYLTAQDVKVTLKVTDDIGVSEVREMPVRIEAPPADPAPGPDPGPGPGPAPSPQPQPNPPIQPAPQVTTSTSTTPDAPTPRGFSFSFRAASTASRVKGAAVKVTCSASCRVTATLSISKSVARKARLGSKAVTIGTARGTLTKAGSKSVRVKLTRKARGRLARTKSVRATLKLAVADASGKTTRKQKAVLLKR